MLLEKRTQKALGRGVAEQETKTDDDWRDRKRQVDEGLDERGTRKTVPTEDQRRTETKHGVQHDRHDCHLESEDERMKRRRGGHRRPERGEPWTQGTEEDRANWQSDEQGSVERCDEADQLPSHLDSSFSTNRRRKSEKTSRTKMVITMSASDVAAAAGRLSLSIRP